MQNYVGNGFGRQVSETPSAFIIVGAGDERQGRALHLYTSCALKDQHMKMENNKISETLGTWLVFTQLSVRLDFIAYWRCETKKYWAMRLSHGAVRFSWGRGARNFHPYPKQKLFLKTIAVICGISFHMAQ
jgi:hypothetical protein